ncbi:hypothetical protein ABZV23_32745, partial [Streptomyces hirsutus]
MTEQPTSYERPDPGATPADAHGAFLPASAPAHGPGSTSSSSPSSSPPSSVPASPASAASSASGPATEHTHDPHEVTIQLDAVQFGDDVLRAMPGKH